MSFEDWWKNYPRRVGKLKAIECYRTQIRKGYTDAELLTGLKHSIADWESRNVGMEFIPHPATYLRQGRWLDENCAGIQGNNELARNLGSEPDYQCLEGYAAIIHRKIGGAMFQAYFRECEFGPDCVWAPSLARRDYILNKFGFRIPDLHIEVRP